MEIEKENYGKIWWKDVKRSLAVWCGVCLTVRYDCLIVRWVTFCNDTESYVYN